MCNSYIFFNSHADTRFQSYFPRAASYLKPPYSGTVRDFSTNFIINFKPIIHLSRKPCVP